MNIFVTGVNYKKTPLEIREKLSFTKEEHATVLGELKKHDSVNECVLLSTCNRTEVYVYSHSNFFNSEIVEKCLCDMKGLDIFEYKKYFYFYSSTKAVKHLFKVASGLDSMVLGEDQILGQVKTACELAMEAGASGSILNGLFREAVTAAKKVKTYTGISKNSLSVASLAVKLLSDYFGGNLEDKTALIIGAGKIGRIALKNLLSKGVGMVYVCNRTHGKADVIAEGLPNVKAVNYDDRYNVINKCDIVISSTTSPHYTITRDMLEKSLTDVRQRAFVDLAVPRDIDVSIKEMPNTGYFNMDDLKLTVERNIDFRMLEVSRADEIIDQSVFEFQKWYDFREVLPVVKEIQRYTGELLDRKIQQTVAKLKTASSEDVEVVKASITNIVKSIMNTFVFNVRKCASKEEMEIYFKCLDNIIKNEQLEVK